MIIRSREIAEENGRRGYPIADEQAVIHHLAVRVTTPDNPFKPHHHAAEELWYIVEGEALVALDGQEHPVETGDVVVLKPWVEHGLRTEGRVKWVCIG